MASVFRTRRDRHQAALTAGAAALALAALTACSASGSPSAPGSPRPGGAGAAPALPAGTPRLAAAFTVPGGGLVNEAQFSADGKLAAAARMSAAGARTHLTAVTSPALVGTEGIPAIGPDASEVLTLAPFAKGGTGKLYLWAIPGAPAGR